MDFMNLCRICTSFTNPESSEKLFQSSQKKMREKIQNITGISLKNLKYLPQNICESCQLDLEQAHDFRERCIASQHFFTTAKIKKTMATRKNRNVKEKYESEDYDDADNDDADNMPIEEIELTAIDEVKEESDVEVKPETELSSDDGIDHLANELYDEIEFMSPRNQARFRISSPTKSAEPKRKSRSTSLERLVNTEINEEEEEMSHIVSDQNEKVKSSPKTKRKKSSKIIKKEEEMYTVSDENEETEDSPKAKRKKSSKAKTKNTDDKPKRKKPDGKSKPKQFICDQCGNHFTGRYRFLNHLQRHTGIKPIECEVCPDKFFTNSELIRHMRKHTGERPFACKHCDRRFTDYSTNVRHERTHTNERPFSCTQCGKSFTTNYILKNHMLVHTGERSYKCDYCNAFFQRPTNLATHNRSISHKQNVESQRKLNKLLSDIA